jgi:hypothetical protein
MHIELQGELTLAEFRWGFKQARRRLVPQERDPNSRRHLILISLASLFFLSNAVGMFYRNQTGMGLFCVAIGVGVWLTRGGVRSALSDAYTNYLVIPLNSRQLTAAYPNRFLFTDREMQSIIGAGNCHTRPWSDADGYDQLEDGVILYWRAEPIAADFTGDSETTIDAPQSTFSILPRRLFTPADWQEFTDFLRNRLATPFSSRATHQHWKEGRASDQHIQPADDVRPNSSDIAENPD